MINQVTRDRINGLSEEYRKLAVKYKEAIKELTISELPEMVYNSNAIENSTLTLEDTEDILIRNQIRTDHEIREIYEAKNLASAIEYLMNNTEKAPAFMEFIVPGTHPCSKVLVAIINIAQYLIWSLEGKKLLYYIYPYVKTFQAFYPTLNT